MKFKNDKYKSVRGSSQLLEITCRKCESLICHYQKDGPGALRRMYKDRMLDADLAKGDLVCKHCSRVLGIDTIFEKEDRPAYRLFVDAVKKRKVSIRSI
jgi:transcription elongation factor Elf1